MRGELNVLGYGLKDGIFNVTHSFDNTGSVPYKLRARMDVYNQTWNIIFTAWSQEFEIYPSEKKVITLYWVPINTSGIFIAQIKVYYGNEIIEGPRLWFKVNKSEGFEYLPIKTNYKIYDEEIEISISEVSQGLIIIPISYPKGWIVEEVKTNKDKTSIRYDPGVWVEGKIIKFLIITEDGRYTKIDDLQIKKRPKIERLIHSFKNFLKFITS
ncbi:MAG: hypothetical protein QXY45_02740 [Candidatus Aenigmatarchaeota archaeon]